MSVPFVSGKRFYWLGFFLPVNGLFEAIFFLLRGFRPDLDAALWLTACIQGGYFLAFSYGVLALRACWHAAPSLSAWGYRLAGLVSLTLLLLHAPAVYHVAQFEREARRAMQLANLALPADQAGNVRAETILGIGRLWIYRTTLKTVSRAQIQPEIFVTTAREALTRPLCDDPWQVRLLANAITVRFRYLDRDGQWLADIDFPPGSCTNRVPP